MGTKAARTVGEEGRHNPGGPWTTGGVGTTPTGPTPGPLTLPPLPTGARALAQPPHGSPSPSPSHAEAPGPVRLGNEQKLREKRPRHERAGPELTCFPGTHHPRVPVCKMGFPGWGGLRGKSGVMHAECGPTGCGGGATGIAGRGHGCHPSPVTHGADPTVKNDSAQCSSCHGRETPL